MHTCVVYRQKVCFTRLYRKCAIHVKSISGQKCYNNSNNNSNNNDNNNNVANEDAVQRHLKVLQVHQSVNNGQISIEIMSERWCPSEKACE